MKFLPLRNTPRKRLSGWHWSWHQSSYKVRISVTYSNYDHGVQLSLLSVFRVWFDSNINTTMLRTIQNLSSNYLLYLQIYTYFFNFIQVSLGNALTWNLRTHLNMRAQSITIHWRKTLTIHNSCLQEYQLSVTFVLRSIHHLCFIRTLTDLALLGETFNKCVYKMSSLPFAVCRKRHA